MGLVLNAEQIPPNRPITTKKWHCRWRQGGRLWVKKSCCNHAKQSSASRYLHFSRWGYRSPQLLGNHNPTSNSILPLLHSFFIGFSMRSTSRKLRHSDNISVVFIAPLNNH